MGVTGVTSLVGDVGEPGASRRLLDGARNRLSRNRFDDDLRPARSSGFGSVGDSTAGDGDGDGDGVRSGVPNHGLQRRPALAS